MSRIKVTNLRHESATSDNISLDSSGRVGIGTASPSRIFQVADSSNAFLSAKCGSVEGFVNVTSTQVNLESSSGIPVTISPGGTLRGEFDTSGNLKFNSGYGSVVTAYGVRAWVNFNGTGTVAIRANGNVTSITDGGTGQYTVNFTTAMPDANYAALCSKRQEVTNQGPAINVVTYSTSSVQLQLFENGSNVDSSIVSVAIVR